LSKRWRTTGYLWCFIVLSFSINGSDTSLAVARQVTTFPAIPFNPLEPTSLSWDNVLARKAWSAQLLTSVGNSIARLEQGNPDAFISGYSTLSPVLPIKFWAELLIAVAKFESSWNPNDIFSEPPPLTEASIGLLQLSYQDQSSYNLEPLSQAARSLQDPLVNLRCGAVGGSALREDLNENLLKLIDERKKSLETSLNSIRQSHF
jgi:hypothetical protein